ncbi:MAG: HEAT repeat domain-containing protein, partial [Cyanobacteria bacterium P01_A01_bin.17]
SLHYSCLYEQAEEPPQVCLKPLRSWAGLSLAFCACMTGSQTVEAQPTLQPGDSGKDVEELHQRLKSAKCWPAGFPSALPNYDDYTGAAVSRLQRRHGEQLALGGVVNEQTAAAIEAGWTCDPAQDEGALRLGSQGEEVRMLQAQLNNWGFPLAGERLEATGIFDPATEAALKEFEAYFGLEKDGIFDPLDSQILWTPRVTALVRALHQVTNIEQAGNALIDLSSTEKEQEIASLLALIEKGENANANIKGVRKEITPSAAALVLLQTDKNAEAEISRLTALVSDDAQSERIKTTASEALGYLGADAQAAVPNLAEVLSDKVESTGVRASAAQALGRIGTNAKSALPNLITVLSDPQEDDSLRSDAAQTLQNIGAGDAEISSDLDLEADQVISDLIRIATDKSNEDEVMEAALQQIGRFGADAEEAVEPLTKILNDPEADFELVLEAVDTLGAIGPTAQSAIPTLRSLLEDQSRFKLPAAEERSLDQELADYRERGLYIPGMMLSQSIASALVAMGNAAVPELISALQSQNEKVRYSAAFALGQMDRLNRDTAGALEAVLNDPNENINIRRRVADSLEIQGRDVQDFWGQTGLESYTTRQTKVCDPNSFFNESGIQIVGYRFNEYVGDCVSTPGEGDGGEPGLTCLSNVLSGQSCPD